MKTWYVHSVEEYLEKIDMIYQNYKEKTGNNSILWFRGHEKSAYHLEPGIYRNFYGKKREQNKYNADGIYGTIQQKEDFRFQHFLARNYDKMISMPGSMIEWQEVMQHYFTKTRLMDWSESAFASLNFALEVYMNPVEDHEVEFNRRMNSPTVWILNPVLLNQKVYDCFEGADPEMLYKAFGSQRKPDELKNDLAVNRDIYFNLNLPDEIKMNGILSLSGLEHMRQEFERNTGQKQESFNPFFYLLLKYYSDGIAVEIEKLPPVAIIHPYHSSRIRNQRGAFTVFPYYKAEESLLFDEDVLNTGFSPYGMELMDRCKSCLDKIVIMNPYHMAEQMLSLGEKRAHLYPEMENMTKDFENNRYGI
ncbi:MAG: FRG domain-containing protein [Eubacteriales bacterium]|nr:FRG domain-containing protein [Eubacteriales bacterium]